MSDFVELFVDVSWIDVVEKSIHVAEFKVIENKAELYVFVYRVSNSLKRRINWRLSELWGFPENETSDIV